MNYYLINVGHSRSALVVPALKNPSTFNCCMVFLSWVSCLTVLRLRWLIRVPAWSFRRGWVYFESITFELFEPLDELPRCQILRLLGQEKAILNQSTGRWLQDVWLTMKTRIPSINHFGILYKVVVGSSMFIPSCPKRTANNFSLHYRQSKPPKSHSSLSNSMDSSSKKILRLGCFLHSSHSLGPTSGRGKQPVLGFAGSFGFWVDPWARVCQCLFAVSVKALGWGLWGWWNASTTHHPVATVFGAHYIKVVLDSKIPGPRRLPFNPFFKTSLGRVRLF